jgi:hypothetical protein
MIDYDNLVFERNRNRFIVWDTFVMWKYCKKGEEKKWIHIGKLQ